MVPAITACADAPTGHAFCGCGRTRASPSWAASRPPACSDCCDRKQPRRRAASGVRRMTKRSRRQSASSTNARAIPIMRRPASGMTASSIRPTRALCWGLRSLPASTRRRACPRGSASSGCNVVILSEDFRGLAAKPLSTAFSVDRSSKRLPGIPLNITSEPRLVLYTEAAGMQKYSTAGAIAALKQPGRYAVGDGAYFQISKWHTRSWIFRYERLGKAHNMGLGPYPLISLADARAKARNAKRMLLDGIDPLHAKRKARTDALLQIARTKTFKECAEQYIATHDSNWSSAKSRAAWVSTFKNYVYPKIGALPVADIDTAVVLGILEPLWSRAPTTASRARGRIETVLGWAGVRGYRSTENPARWTGHLEHILPSPNNGTEHLASLPYQQIGSFMAALRAEPGIAARALEFNILKALRPAEGGTVRSGGVR